MGAAHEEMALYQSAAFLRMNSLDEEYRMPMIGREEIDYSAVDLIHKWMMTLPTPEEFDFGFTKKGGKHKLGAQNIPQPLAKTIGVKIQPFTGKGLHITAEFSSPDSVPPVMIIYWPEDDGLSKQAVIDHNDGNFTEKLIVGNKGSVMSLRNSDDVGHTIYVKDKRRDIRWQLNYMSPGSRFEQDLFWEEDTFVEMRCRLHLYMSAWAGSIKSRYYTVVEFNEGETIKRKTIRDFPEEFTNVKIWMPKNNLIDTIINKGEVQTFNIKSIGKLTLQRSK